MSKQDPHEPFSVYQFFPDDSYERVGSGLDAEEAVIMAKRLTQTLSARIGATRRVIITDSDDFTNFVWEYGKGVTYPRHDGIKYVAD